MLLRLSYDIEDKMPVFPGNPNNITKEYHNLKKDGVETHTINLFTHNGTHIDLPRHYLDGVHGKDITCYNLCNFVYNNAHVVDFQKNLPLKNHKDLLIIRTHIDRGKDDYSYLTEEMAREIRKYDYRCIGVDTMSITNPKKKEIGEKVHKILFEKDIFIIEDMDLTFTNHYNIKKVFAIPLFIKGIEASPCTVFAEVDE